MHLGASLFDLKRFREINDILPISNYSTDQKRVELFLDNNVAKIFDPYIEDNIKCPKCSRTSDVYFKQSKISMKHVCENCGYQRYVSRGLKFVDSCHNNNNIEYVEYFIWISPIDTLRLYKKWRSVICHDDNIEVTWAKLLSDCFPLACNMLLYGYDLN